MLSISARIPDCRAASVSLATAAGLVPPRHKARWGRTTSSTCVIKGGDVLDPSQTLRGKRDIGIRYGLIEAIEADIPAERARTRARRRRQAGDAGADRPARARLSVWLGDRHPGRRAGPVPGHDHAASRPATPAPTTSPPSAATSSAQTRTRLYAFVHIANIGLAGFPVPELYNIDFAQRRRRGARRSPRTPTSCSASRCACRENVIAKHGARAAQARDPACEMAGGRREGDVPHRRRRDARADVADPRPAAPRRHPHALLFGRAEHRRRVHQHRAGRQAAAGGAGGEAARRDLRRRPRRRQLRLHGRRGGDRSRAPAPDTISSDIHVFSGNSPGMPYLTWVMSKFLSLGFTLEQVVAMATVNAGQGRSTALPKLGTLQVGAPADVVAARGGRGPGRVRRHAQQQARGAGAPQAGADGARRRAVRPAL